MSTGAMFSESLVKALSARSGLSARPYEGLSNRVWYIGPGPHIPPCVIRARMEVDREGISRNG